MTDYSRTPLLGLTIHSIIQLIRWIEKYPRKGDLHEYQDDFEILGMLDPGHLKPAGKNTGKKMVKCEHEEDKLVVFMLWTFKYGTNPSKMMLCDILFESPTITTNDVSIWENLCKVLPKEHPLKIHFQELALLISDSNQATTKSWEQENKPFVLFTKPMISLILKNIPISSKNKYLSRIIATEQYLQDLNQQSPTT
jgi:hypothetical protein